jgi:hypothetical protein
VKRALLIMARQPLAGRSKTRLEPVLTPAAAAALYACFLRDTLDLARTLPGVTPIVAYAPPAARAYFQKLAPGLDLVPQRGQTLGERLAHVLSQTLASGFGRVAAMNSDSPTLPPDYLSLAFDKLDGDETDVVLGPCEDGGYYLIGWKRPHPRLVREVQMSTAHVLQDTLALAAEDDLRVDLLPPWYDVDRPRDLQRVTAELSRPGSNARHTRRFLQSAGIK